MAGRELSRPAWQAPKLSTWGRRATTALQRNQMQAMYLAGATCVEIAPLFGVSAKTVSTTLRNMGTPMRPPGRSVRKRSGGPRG